MRTDCGPILIVDGDLASRTLLSELMQWAGYSTVEAESGEEALDAAREERPGLVLLEVALPGISGYEVCSQLRERFGEQLPVVVVSGTRTESYDRAAGLLIGADDYMVKPFLPDELVARVRRLLIRKAGDSKDRESGRISSLTEREQQVLRLLAEGTPPKAIAAELFISPKTVAMHLQHILVKLDVHSRAEAVALAYREGLVTQDTVAH